MDFSKAGTVNLPDTLAEIINRKIYSLSPEVKNLLEIASCVGSRFSLELMGNISKSKVEYIEELCRVGLIIEVFKHPESDNTREFEFFHDRIYQNVYEHIEPARKEQLHFDIAMELLNHSDKIFIDENILSITAHLLKCKNVIKREGVGERLIVDLFFAGIKAKRSAAFEHALELLSLGEELLGNSCWKEYYHNTLKIKLELTECEFICGYYEAARAHFGELQEHAACEEDLAEIKKRYMILNSYTGNHEQVINLGFQALKHLGYKFNTQFFPLQIIKEILYGKFLFRSSRLETIKNAPIITDERLTNVMEILTIMVASANLKDEKLFALIVLKIGNLSAKYGNSLYSPLAYAAYSLVLGPGMGNFKKAAKLMEISLNLAELFDDELFGAATYFCIGTFVAHWLFPAKESLNYLQRAFDCGIQSGDYLYCGYTLIMMTEMKYLMGEPLDELEKFLKLHEKYEQKINNDTLMRSFATFKDHINMLSLPDFSPDERLIEDREVEIQGTNESMIYFLLKAQRMYLDGKIDEAYNLLKKFIKHLDSVIGSITQVDYVFYFLLVSLERLKIKGESSFWQIERSCRKYIKKLERWAQLSPKNYLGKYLLIEALLASLKHQQQDAARLYDEAIEHAKVNNNLLLEALGNYLAADYFSYNRKISKVYAQDACQLFLRWGAVTMAQRICEQYKINVLAASEASFTSDMAEISENNGQISDILFRERAKDHQKELEALNLEDAHKYFLDNICKEIGADNCAILLEEGDSLKLEYICQDGQAAVKFPGGIDLEQVEYLPKKVIRYAGRTFEEVIIEAKPVDGPFASDDYIKKRSSISIICLPLKYNDIFTGLIYLESQSNNRFNSLTVEHIKHQCFYLVAKQALERETYGSNKIFINQTVKEQLTEREMEVLYYMAKGMTNKEIGEKLCISASTVKTHTINIYGKLEVNSRIQAVTKAKLLKLI